MQASRTFKNIIIFPILEKEGGGGKGGLVGQGGY